jgi:hypothetical protein
MKNQEMFIKKLISEYDVKISNCEKEVQRYTSIKNQIKDKHNGCPTKYECDFDYQQMVKDITICNTQIQAYTQAKADFDSILNYYSN